MWSWICEGRAMGDLNVSGLGVCVTTMILQGISLNQRLLPYAPSWADSLALCHAFVEAMKAPFLAAGLLAASTFAGDVDSSTAGLIQCKCLPRDPCWPPTSDWNSLNQTVGGRLIATVPLAHPCHDPNYNPERCQALQDEWQNAPIQ
jgi:hypothetical protein